MESIIPVFLVPVLAVLLDSFVGDPKHWPHPVRLIGRLLDLYESSARKTGFNLRTAGWTAVILFPATAWAAVGLLTSIKHVGFLFAVYFAYAGLALGCLMREARNVASLLDSGDLNGARSALAMLVSRDTSALNAAGVRRTLAETVSENLNDGFTAPLFYLCLFGPGGMWAYKTVSTMDSMWGYRTDRFRDLGRGAAKTDDLLAWIPARITARLLLFAGKRMGLDAATARSRYREDAVKMESPNAGWPMSAAAWLLQGKMGGPTVYFGETKDKPVLNPQGAPWDKPKIKMLFTLVRKTGSWTAWTLIPALGVIRLVFA
ncbi:adenosylcobinamide-phosphate synthase CbiB [Pseudodesulfovibrio indicus]|uniref:adenosylcobinamide-phosphate synthase CbiB n=1 Tax=Pseudodesulfovibrio indicus TaxID=1716143 RepID=UPI00292F12B5|nr:adenosylcobinamide-phosphate synthase CbiB [Pseudodesulfovibrio indicus]